VSKRIMVVGFTCLLNLCQTNPAIAQKSDQVAERVFGPQWKQLSRRAGIIFAGTVLTNAAKNETKSSADDRTALQTIPSVQITLRVDHAISGVEPGQILTIHEWAGSSSMSMHSPMRSGQRILIFLYPPSRLGLTSPVGGLLGQIALDPSGATVSRQERDSGETTRVSIVQLERAIRSAREE
jgi:hypothetical protein